uniref:Uncharacterized protein n=1 Tax=Arundo donax TaxID=35708 RepID=A0A0A9AIE2_ARUDO
MAVEIEEGKMEERG